jgi:dTDP-4-amino-4,6-dideoxygalactose transaminase
MSSTDDGRKVNLFEPDIGQIEKDAVLSVLDSGWLAMGARCKQFEEEFAQYLGVKYAVALSSCTSALHIAYLLADVGPGDEVIVPSLTFVATANAVAYCGGKAVFADIVSDSDWTISAEAIEASITKKTKAICVMHYGGYSCDMDAIERVAQAHGIPIIEDACHGLGGSIASGKMIGSVGQTACFSFYSNKAITTGEGGMLVTNDAALAQRARLLRAHGMTNTTYDRVKGAMGYDVTELGYNYRLDEIRSAIGLAQMSRLPVALTMRKRLAAHYAKRVAQIAGVSLPNHGARGTPAHYVLPVIVDEEYDRDRARLAMHELGVQTSIHYEPVHSFGHYAKAGWSLPLTESVASRTMSLPLYPSLEEDAVDIICDRLASVLPGCKK